jgi:arsenate reductase (glutaredoxin)
MITMPRLTIYQKPTCSTCRDVMTRLNTAGVDYDAINYIIEPPSREKLAELVRKMNVSPREIMRPKEARELGLEAATMSDDELLDAMIENPSIIQRPILEYGELASLARPADRVGEFIEAMKSAGG